MEYTKISKKMKSPVDGLELDLLILVPEEAPKGILQIHHGMAEYKERYLPFMKYFAEAGYVVAIHDCRGHGKSVRTKKDLGYMYGAGMDALIEDTAEVTRMLKEEWQGVPLILLGHSMGSMVVRCFTKKYDDLLNMLVVCGSPSKNPGAKIGIALAAVQEKISGAHHVSRFLELLSLGSYSGKFVGEGSRFAWCCSDEQVVRAYEASELCGFTFTVDADQVLFQLMDETGNRSERYGRSLPDILFSDAGLQVRQPVRYLPHSMVLLLPPEVSLQQNPVRRYLLNQAHYPDLFQGLR